jgi:hypothetical protein
MNPSPDTQGCDQSITVRIASALLSRPKLRLVLRWLVLGLGLIAFVAIQTGFIAGPLWTRAMLPEVDDTYAYLVKTAEMEQCFLQNCPALEDLREQIPKHPSDKEIAWQKSLLEGRIFMIFHPLFSAILIALKQFLPDLATAYKVLWTSGPAFFGLAFAYWLFVLWGPGPAGVALLLLSTKVFPSNGIHYVVPSCLAVGIGLLSWGRIISRNGHAPWSLLIGSLLMILTHPMGRVFAVIGIVISWVLSGCPMSVRRTIPHIIASLMVAAAFVAPKIIQRPHLDLTIEGGGSWPAEFANSILQVMVEIVRFEVPLFGSLCLFVGAAVYGYLVAPPDSRRRVRVVAIAFVVFSAISLFYIHPDHPADVFLRLWIPLIVLLFGAVGNAVWCSMRQTVSFIRNACENELSIKEPAAGWQVVVFAVLATFSFQMMLFGAEGFAATADYMKNRQALFLDPAQPAVMMSRAKPGDRVVYDNVLVVMPFYFVHGAMKLGAVYYPVLKDSFERKKWLERPDVRFAVMYNPIVSLPGFQDTKEDEWWTSTPEYRFSPLSTPRKDRQVGREGKISAASLKSMEIRVADTATRSLSVSIENDCDTPAWISVTPVDNSGQTLENLSKKLEVPERWSGWLDTGATVDKQIKTLRITFHPLSRFLIGGLRFGENGLHWPWAQGARLTLVPKAADSTPIVIGYTPEELLPPPLNARKATVLHDSGSTVLLEVGSPK